MNIYSHFNGRYQFFFEGKWRSDRTLALMLKRRHNPEETFRHLDNGRRLTMVVGSWDMTRAEWEARRPTVGHALHFGSIFDIHEHVWLGGECQVCRMNQALHDRALDMAAKASGRSL